MADELKPCPFCGENGLVEEFGRLVLVQCCGCGVATDGSLTEAEAIAAWNRRANEAELVAALREFVAIDAAARVFADESTTLSLGAEQGMARHNAIAERYATAINVVRALLAKHGA